MNNKKIQAQMQVNVSFLGNTAQLLKQLQDTTKQLNLDSSLYKPLATSLSKGFKEAFDNLNQMTSGLSKKGLSTKQYTDFFNDINAKFKESIRFVDDLKKHLSDAFNSPENKQGLKDLKAYRAQLEEIQKLSTKQKAAVTRKNTAIQKFNETTGLDYEVVGDTLGRIRGKLANNKTLRKDDIAWLDKSGLTNTEKLKQAFDLLTKIEEKIEKINSYDKEASGITGKPIASSITTLNKEIAKLEKTIITPEMAKDNAAIATTADQATVALTKETDVLGNKLSSALNEAEKQAKATAMATSTLKEVFAQFGIHFSAASIIKGFIDLVKSSFEFYKSLDSALNEIYVVSSLSINKVNELQQSFINMAKTTGMALDDITRAAVLFYQQGLNTSEVLEMTRVTAQFAKVAGIDATDAADKLTAAVNGYRLSAEDAMSVADKFNKVAAASAADINELSTAFSKAAAQANQAGVSMDNYLAYIATMEEATREAPENLGTSLKTIFSRMQQIKSGENTEDNTDVNAVETALRSVNIALRDTNGQLRDLEDIFAELGPRWNTLDRNTQAYLGTIIAGTRQQSRFITLMQNWDRVLDLAAQSENSAGQQALMHAKAMDSITSKLQQLNVAWQEFISNISNSAAFKGVISSLTKILNLLNSGNKPIAAIMLAFSLLSRKLKDFNAPLSNKFKDFSSMVKSGGLINGITGLFENKDQKTNRLDNEINEQEQTVRLLKEKYEIIKDTGEKIELNNGEIHNELTLKEKITEEEERLKQKIIERNNAEKDGEKAVARTVASIGTAIQSLSLLVDDTNTSGLLSGAGGLVGGIARFGYDPIGGAVQAITSLVTLGKTIADWSKNLEKKITDNVAKVQDALTNYNNASTELKNTTALVDKYKKLSSTIMKTATQQEELNKVAQELADSYDLETVIDDFGNLTISMRDVEDAMADLAVQQEKALKELNEQELDSLDDALSGIFNSNTMSDYYRELYSTNRSGYRSMLKGLEDGLTEETRYISDNVAKKLNNNLKTSIIREVENHAAGYVGMGQAGAMQSFETAYNNVSSNEWNELYYEIEFIRSAMENMTFDEVQNHMEEFYSTWSANNKLTAEQWAALKDSINNTVFENSSLLNFYNKVNEMQGKGSGTYYKGDAERLQTQLNDLREKKGNLKSQQAGATIGGGTLATLLAAGILSFTGVGIPAAAAILAGSYAAGATGGYFASNTTDTKKYKAVEKAIKELEKTQKEYYKTVAENDPFLDGEKQGERYVQVLENIKNALTGTSTENANFWSNIDSAMDLSTLTSIGQREDFGKIITNLISQTEGFTNDGDRYNVFAKAIEEQLEQLAQSDSEYAIIYAQQLEKIREEAYNSLPTSSSTTFTQLSTDLDKISEKLRSMNTIVSEFKENKGVMSLESFSNLASILDSIDFSALGQLKDGEKYIDQTITALENLNLAYDANTGMIKMNGQSLKSLQDVQQAQTKAALISKANELKANAAAIKSEIAMVDAQIAATKAVIEQLATVGDGEIKASKLEQEVNSKLVADAKTRVNEVKTTYETDLQNQGKWTTAIIKNLAKATNAWNIYYTAVKDGTGDVSQLYKDAMNATSEVTWGALNPNSKVDWKSHTDANGYLTGITDLRTELTNYLTELEHTKDQYTKSLTFTEAQIDLLTSMANSDLSKLGTSSSSSKTDSIQVYIGQLKEIYNILNRIDMLEHRLNTLDTYADISKEKVYGNLLQQRLNYNQELLNQYDFLVSEQKKFTNGYKDFIGTVEGLEGVFDFDQFGQIIINWEKYIKLQDTAAKGEVTLKQKADDVYETYQKMFDELKQDFDNYIKYLKNVIGLLQEVIDAYKNMQSKAVSAVKEIYQKILNDRLEAIDKEKKALDELKEARTRARTDQENAKAMSGLQTNLQRAMMDTSGASDSNFIKAQKDIDDKLEKIADDKYSQMLQDIQKALDEEKDALQKDFEELWENLDWLHEWLDNDIMQNRDVLISLFEQTEEWQTASPLRRQELLQDWGTQYETYMSQLTGGKTIFDVWTVLNQTRARIGDLDFSLQTDESKDGKEIIQTIKSWQKDVNNTVKSAVNNAVTTATNNFKKYVNNNNNNIKNNNNKTENDVGPNKAIDIKAAYCNVSIDDGVKGYCETSKRKCGSTMTLPSPTRSGYQFKGWKCSDGKTYSAGQSITIPDVDSIDFVAIWKNAIFAMPKGMTLNAHFASGGLATFTGPAWLDGTRNAPEAVLNPLQTEHFMHFTNVLDKMYSGVGQASNSSSVSIDNISFNVESMSSPEDGEKAFNMFVSKFKEIGNQTGIKMNNFKNTI